MRETANVLWALETLGTAPRPQKRGRCSEGSTYIVGCPSKLTERTLEGVVGLPRGEDAGFVRQGLWEMCQ